MKKLIGKLTLRTCFFIILIFISTFNIYTHADNFVHPSKPGGAGYALVFHDNLVVKSNFNDFPKKQLTFEAWLSTSDLCHPGAIMSFAKQTSSVDVHKRTEAANHFVIFDTQNIIACHDFEYIDIIPDYQRQSCHSHYNRTAEDAYPITATISERDGTWHHVAVTWDGENKGEIFIYVDGVVVGRAVTEKTEELDPNGSLVLGGEQDCYAGCTDPNQGFYGYMDEVRIWKVVRKPDQIIKFMRQTGSIFEGDPNLIAYWKFDDPGTKGYEDSGIVRDSSGKGNDLDLLIPPNIANVNEKVGEKTLKTSSLVFKNNYAKNPNISKMPHKDITIEFWARTAKHDPEENPLTIERYAEFFSFATMKIDDGIVGNDYGYADTAFIDDAIRIEKYYTEYNGTRYLTNSKVNTTGSISIHINANRDGNGKEFDNWLDYAIGWLDAAWHHVAVTWEFSTGETHLYFDGERQTPFWRASKGVVSNQDPGNGGVSKIIGENKERSPYGSLVLGQNQECYGGCFSPSSAFNGAMANLRIWNRVLDRDTINKNMYEENPKSDNGLVMNYVFSNNNLRGSKESQYQITEHKNDQHLYLGSIKPTFDYSYAPLTDASGNALSKPEPGYMGYAMGLNDQQLLMLKNFDNFPSDAITVEFWMWSVDSCREGAAFSYATGKYEEADNSFLIFNYNNWGIAVMEDEGTIMDHNAGFGSTDGKWHHIAVTWESSSGTATLYDNGRPQWRVKRAQGKKIPSGGTLVIGREQDCLGGCFDSDPGAIGNLDPISSHEYKAQDFFGIIEQVRVWKVARSVQEIYHSMEYDLKFSAGNDDGYITPSHKDLVAWWKFDEGKGFTIKDETGHGHDLMLTANADWIVTRGKVTCGNGEMEPLEECDDGNIENGDGCSSKCKIEPGWTCDPTSPSVCLRNQNVPAPKPKSDTGSNSNSATSVTLTSNECHNANCRPTNSNGDTISAYSNAQEKDEEEKAQKSHVGKFFLILFIFAIIAILVYVVFKKRTTIYEYVPAVEEFVHSSKEKINRAMGRHDDYSLVALDPEETNVSPGFVNSQPPTSYERPTENIPYEPINDGTKK